MQRIIDKQLAALRRCNHGIESAATAILTNDAGDRITNILCWE